MCQRIQRRKKNTLKTLAGRGSKKGSKDDVHRIMNHFGLLNPTDVEMHKRQPDDEKEMF